jgi:hypothetical protein
MKKNRVILMVLMLIVCIMITACNTNNNAETLAQPETEAPTEAPTEPEIDFEKAIKDCIKEYDKDTNKGSTTGWNSDIVKKHFVVSSDGMSMEYIDPNYGASMTKGVKPSIAVKYMNSVLGLSDSVYRKMEMTRAIDGMQTDESDKIKVSWNYHPKSGLSVIYEKK